MFEQCRAPQPTKRAGRYGVIVCGDDTVERTTLDNRAGVAARHVPTSPGHDSADPFNIIEDRMPE